MIRQFVVTLATFIIFPIFSESAHCNKILKTIIPTLSTKEIATFYGVEYPEKTVRLQRNERTAAVEIIPWRAPEFKIKDYFRLFVLDAFDMNIRKRAFFKKSSVLKLLIPFVFAKLVKAEGHKKAAGLLFFLGLLVTYSNQPDKKQVALGSGVMVRYKKTRKELGEDAVRRSFLLSKRADEAPLNLENLSSVERFVIKCLGSGVVQWVALSLLAGLILKENSGQIRSVADAAKRSVVDFAASENIKSFSS